MGILLFSSLPLHTMEGACRKIQLFGIMELRNAASVRDYHRNVRPVFHPSLEDVTVEGILHALSDPARAAILADIVGSECSQNCLSVMGATKQAIPKSTLSQHFKILREAGLVRGERHGVEMLNSSRCAEIDQRFPGLIAAIVNAHNIQLTEKERADKAAKRRSGKRSAGTG